LIDHVLADVAKLVGAGSDSGGIRVGIDVVSIPKFSATIQTRAGQAFVRSCFTEQELIYSAGRPERLAARWAAKEAVAKAVGTGFRGLRPIQIEVVREPSGQVGLAPSPDPGWPAGAHDWPWELSLAHEGDAAVAIALALVPEAIHDRAVIASWRSAVVPDSLDATEPQAKETAGG
jgi:holo-[acyl-carrier protein] synthase